MSNFSLYQISQLATFENYIDTDTGEVDIDNYNRAQIDFHEKQLAVVCYLKNETGRIDLLDNAIRELIARKKAMQTRYDGLKEYLLVNMQAHAISEISAQDSTFSARIKKNPPKLVIDDAGQLPSELYIYPETPPPNPDNAAIKAKLLAGEVINGARLESGYRLEIK